MQSVKGKPPLLNTCAEVDPLRRLHRTLRFHYRKKRARDGREQGINDPMMPVAWTRLHDNPGGRPNRVFCTTMGAANEFENEGLRRLVVNGVYWGLGLDVPTKAPVDFVDEYKPGFTDLKDTARA